MTAIPVLSDAQKILKRLQSDPVVMKNFRLKVGQGLAYLSDDPASLTTDLQLVSFEQSNPQPMPSSQSLPSKGEVDKEGESKSAKDTFCHELIGQPQWIWKVLPTQDHTQVFTCGGDKMIYKWQLQSHNYHIQNFGIHDGPVYDMVLNRDQSVLYSGSKDCSVKAWSVDDGTLLKQYDFDFEIFKLILDKDERRIIVGGVNGEIRIVDVESCISDSVSGHSSVVRDLVLSSDGATLYSCAQDRLISRWNIDEQSCLKTSEAGLKEVFQLVLNKDESVLYSTGNENKVNVWSLPDMAKKAEFELEAPAGCMALSPSNGKLYVGLQTGVTQVFDTATQAAVGRLTGHVDRVTSIWVAANEQLVFTSSKDKTVKIWENLELKEGLRNFNLNTKRGNLFSVDLSDEALLLEPVVYKALNERPNAYHLTLTDELENPVMSVKLKPISYKPKDDVEDPEETIKIRLETITEFQVSVGDVLENPALFQDFKFTTRFDNQEYSSALTLQHVIQKDGITMDQIQEAVAGFQPEPKNKPDLIRDVNTDGDIAAQVAALLENFDDDYLEHDEEYKSKIEAIGRRLRDLEEKSARLGELNEKLGAFFAESSNSIEMLNEEVGKVLESDEMRQNLTDFFFRIKAKNPFVDSILVKGTLTHGVMNGFCTRVDSNELTVKGEFRNGLLNGRGLKITKPNILSGWFKDGVLEKKPFCIYERNGIIRVADESGEINKLIFKGITYKASGISEIYEGPAFVLFPDGTCFTSVIKNLRLVGDVINKHLVFYYGPEKKSHFLVYDEATKMLKEEDRNLFQLNWEQALVVKL